MLLCLLAGLGRLSAQKEMAQAEKLPILASSSWRQSVGGRKGEQKKGGMGIALLRNGGTGISIPPPLVAAAHLRWIKKAAMRCCNVAYIMLCNEYRSSSGFSGHQISLAVKSKTLPVKLGRPRRKDNISLLKPNTCNFWLN